MCHYQKMLLNDYKFVGSGCGAVGRAVASDTRGPPFESSHQQNLYELSTVLKIKKKEAGKGPIFLKKVHTHEHALSVYTTISM